MEPDLAKAAGDCLDEKQCKQCASRVRTGWGGVKEGHYLKNEHILTDVSSQVLQHMREIQAEADRTREKRLLRAKGEHRNSLYWVLIGDRKLNRSIPAARPVPSLPK